MTLSGLALAIGILFDQATVTIENIHQHLEPYFYSKIFPKVRGFVKTVNVDRGTWVKKGQIIANIEAPELLSELAEFQAKLVQSESSYAASLAIYNRLFETNKTAGAVAISGLETAKGHILSDEAAVNSAKTV